MNSIENDFEIINHSDSEMDMTTTDKNYVKSDKIPINSNSENLTKNDKEQQILNVENMELANKKSSLDINKKLNKIEIFKSINKKPSINSDDKYNLPEIVLTSFDNTDTTNIDITHPININDSISLDNPNGQLYQDLSLSISDLNLDRKLSVSSNASSSNRSRNSSFSAFSIKRNLSMASQQSTEKPLEETLISELKIDNHESRSPKNDLDRHIPYDMKCHICHKVFKDPRTLDCLHSFCFDCLVNENITKDSSIPFWSHPENKNMDWNNSSQLNFRNSLKSESRSSISSLKSRKSIDKSSLKDKSTNKQISLSIPNEKTDKSTFIICSICQYCTEMPISGIRQLPKNQVMVRKIDMLLLKIGNEIISNIWCGLCSEEIPAVFHCSTCILNLCSFCKDAHVRQKSTAGHTIHGLLDLRKSRNRDKSSIDLDKFTTKCYLHPELELKLFCINCNQIICTDCSILLHKDHKYEQGNKVIKNYLKLIKESADKTRPLCEYTDHSITKLANCSRKLNEKCNQIQNDVENFMTEYFEAVDVHRRTLVQQISRARETKMQLILEQQIEMEKRSADAKAAVEFSQELLDNGTYVEILSYVKTLLKRFEYCQKNKPPLDSKISDALHFLPEIRAPSTKDQNNIPLFGIITTQIVEPQFSTLETEGYSQLRVHKKVELIVLSRDADGMQLCHGGLILNVQVKYKENISRTLDIQVSDKRDGTYVVSFIPDYAGTLTMSITIDKRHIKGSPFTLIARTLRPHSGHFHCCSFCSGKGSKTVTCACEGTMVGYKGCGHGHTGHPGRRHWSCCGSILENSECTTANQF